jgi:hypothetical protein
MAFRNQIVNFLPIFLPISALLFMQVEHRAQDSFSLRAYIARLVDLFKKIFNRDSGVRTALFWGFHE